VLDTAFEAARELAEKAPLALAAAKSLINRAPDALGAEEEEEFGELFGSADTKEGLTAFVEKRKARPYLGR
jgi:enoyl-CoA hydratase/carnithine racemase